MKVVRSPQDDNTISNPSFSFPQRHFFILKHESIANMTFSMRPDNKIDLDCDEIERDEVEQVQLGGVTFTKEEEAKLVRKIDLFLLPTIWLMYLLSYM